MVKRIVIGTIGKIVTPPTPRFAVALVAASIFTCLAGCTASAQTSTQCPAATTGTSPWQICTTWAGPSWDLAPVQVIASKPGPVPMLVSPIAVDFNGDGSADLF